jgi:fatty-acyl-CoA synthase
MTETGVLASLTRADDAKKSEKVAYESIGQVIPYLELKIVDPNTKQIVERNVDGEMCLRGFNITRGYYDDPKKTAEAIDSNG